MTNDPIIVNNENSSTRKRQYDNFGRYDPPIKQRSSIGDRLGEKVNSGHSEFHYGRDSVGYKERYYRDNSRDREIEYGNRDRVISRIDRFSSSKRRGG